MPWKASSVMEERLRFVARLMDGEAMTDVWPRVRHMPQDWLQDYDRYGLAALSHRSRHQRARQCCLAREPVPRFSFTRRRPSPAAVVNL
jgi:hypothetical protein